MGGTEVFGALFETHRSTLRPDDRLKRADCVGQEGPLTVEKTLIDMYSVNAWNSPLAVQVVREK